ncbi:MAG: cyclic di-GMP phosphodiesterase [bacterium]|nr:MAG: cyclic di-GMP phosphodiesterase [bacterium]
MQSGNLNGIWLKILIKKISVENLKAGMFIHDFNCTWMEIPFLSRSLFIKEDRFIEKILKHGIREVYIDTLKGQDVTSEIPLSYLKRELVEKIEKTDGKLDAENRKTSISDRVPLREEMGNARRIRRFANIAVKQIMQDVKSGKQFKVEKASEVVAGIVDSVFNNRHALISLSRMKKKDEYTFMHSVSVCVLMVSFCRILGMEQDEIKEMGLGALLHDIGKINIPDSIFKKDGKLTPYEFDKFKKHVGESIKILQKRPNIPQSVLDIAAQHHERLDGSGYPQGLRGGDISRCAQITAIVDVYDSMISDPLHGERVEPVGALKYIFEWSGYYFDKELVEKFIRCVGIYPTGSLVRTESGFLGVVIGTSGDNLLFPEVRLVFNLAKKKFVAPRDVDLSKTRGDKIIASEIPLKWKINPQAFIDI